MTISKLLIANRGEIAVRIIRTCRERGIRTVAVFSEVDREALHVHEADEALSIGLSEASSSYLNIPNLLVAADESNSDSIHPGYGFLSENAEFAGRVEEAGLVWVGPHVSAMKKMSSKIEARKLATSLGIPVVPGGEVDSDLVNAGSTLGFPLMIKASAGGGGRGIRIVRDISELESAASQAEAEAEAAFGDGKLILERYVENPRHVEVQVLGDKHGNVVHLFDRDCSVQRRHQKVVEEAPAPNLSKEQKEEMYSYSLQLAQSMKYDSLGTVEFLVDVSTSEIFFLEMNTRLQVEHPVTEEITGLDLVSLQISSAAGDKLAICQEDIKTKGSAIEVRVNAEDPRDDFSPQSGSVWEFVSPRNGARCDTGIRSGSIVPRQYDSLLPKVISLGDTMAHACAKLTEALSKMTVAGISNNLSFLQAVISSPQFQEAGFTTRFIEEQGSKLLGHSDQDLARDISALALSLPGKKMLLGRSPWKSLGNWRLLSSAGHPERVQWYLEDYSGIQKVTVTDSSIVSVNGRERRLEAYWVSDKVLSIRDGRVSHLYEVTRWKDRIHVVGCGCRAECRVVFRENVFTSNEGASSDTATQIIAPFPGLISEVCVVPGQEVSAGNTVLVIEAMKMMHNLVARGDGVVKELFCEAGMPVEGGQVLVSFSDNDS
ncbi:ATP-grasp domain-containing protein [Myxococcota bacterium]|nr:ATP-grasp domain-containing protein [Myxococcota bacterium]